MNYVMNYLTTPFQSISKFGGRYCMHDGFNPSHFFSNVPSFKIIQHEYYGEKHTVVEPVIYNIPYDYFSGFKHFFQSIGTSLYNDVEHMLYDYVKRMSRVNRLKIIGVFGRYAVSGASRFL